MKRILWLNVTQFLGALNDNLLKLLIVFSLIARHGTGDAARIAGTAGVAFVLPFILFSAPAGSLADRLSKSRLIVAIKCVEVGVTLLAVAGLAADIDPLLYAAVFLMGSHSALFAPAKYGAIPELVEREDLSRANGMVEAATFLAIIIGTALASLLAARLPHAASGAVCVAIAVGGLCTSLRIPATVAAASGRAIALFPLEIARTVGSLRSDRELLLAIGGLAWFMGVGAFAQLNLIPYGVEVLRFSETQSGFLFLVAAAGIAAGSLAAARLSGRSVEFGVVPLGAAGLTGTPLLLHLAPSSTGIVLPVIFLFGVSAGLFSLPLQTFIQLRAGSDVRGKVLAASSFVNWVAICAASLLTWIFSAAGLSAGEGFSIIGGATLLLAAETFRKLPDFLVRFIALVIVRIFYRLRVIDARQLPEEGGALLVPNHVSWVDALLLTATTVRRIRFVMERSIYRNPLLNPLFRLMRVIPVSSTDGRREIVEFLRETRAALDAGYLVCIFAEGAITRNGMMGEFRGGFRRIVQGSSHPVIPVYIGGAWGSIFSYAHGRLLSRLPERIPYPVTILFGSPMPSSCSEFQVRQAVSELSCSYFESLKGGRRPLAEEFLRCARRNWRRRAIADSSGKSLTYGRTVAAALSLSRRLATVEGEHVGVLLPPCVPAVLANLALSLLGRIPVNLNYTAPAASLASAVRRCRMGSVVTSRAFQQRLAVHPEGVTLVFIEDLASITPLQRLSALLRGRFLPLRHLCRRRDFSPDAAATVIFSSGSTGEPKGVVLTHHNIASNIEALRMLLRVDGGDNICSALPLFHSLGFTGTLWLPLLSGFSAVYHSNPMEGEKIAEAVREHRSTLLLSTPTFLQAYLRRARREDFATLRLVVTGAEKLNERIADAFQHRFGVRPLEGYGATELSPVIALSVPEVEIDGVRQQGARQGSVGRPIPGVAVRVVDTATGKEMEPGGQGMILVKGPNVMAGYLGDPERTAEVLREGWYLTGDIGCMDEDGFLRITDRISRFSKIGGEMVPHGAVEDEIHAALGRSGVVAVTAVPDEKKGEKLVVFFAAGATDGETIQRLLGESAIPNLWKPSRECCIGTEELPLLGSGKLDLRALKEAAVAETAKLRGTDGAAAAAAFSSKESVAGTALSGR